ncbi:asparagine synthase (glutamine-hydrolyzing) [Roseivirga sp.]|uniref:asparagine synthase (glutamine-hydrolyzing) n=1 Tax=Roseivirga sp. TaxID=1964215 RepID=UPI002B26D62D|nr:asparagine synthase (glutamine-hydrolyzing) [Roseivirga sp.]
MCGIAGFIDFSHHSSKEQLIAMTDTLTHRGPDASGYVYAQNEIYQLGFGHRRLSILDLSENGQQPMYSTDGQYAIVYNGEVYNFPEIRSWLHAKGYRFKSNSDTEVILYALIEEGIKAIDRFIGMFAIAFVDKVKQELFLIRDRVGVKPLYYSWDSKTLLFASETRAFHNHPSFKKNLNPRSIASYLDFDYIKGGGSVFESVNSVKPGHYVKLDLTTKDIIECEYWSIDDSFQNENQTADLTKTIDDLDDLLVDACKLRMVSDVPVGVFLSGGLDSTTVAAILQKHHSSTISTFTIGFDEKEFNEAEKAKAIAKYLGTDHHELYCSENELLDIFPRLPEIYDEPFADKSAIPTTLVSEFARKHVTVALSADGGDEVFAGYNKYSNVLDRYAQIAGQSDFFRCGKKETYKLLHELASSLSGSQSKVALKTFSELKYLGQFPDVVEMMISSTHNFGKRDLEKLLSTYKEIHIRNNVILNRDHLTQIQAYDFKDYLPDDILIKLDRAAMSVSLEGREPLLDHRIAEFAARLPSDFKIRDGVKKYILAEVNAKYIPRNLTEGPKKGFAIPKKKWMHMHLKDHVMTYLSDVKVKDSGVFDLNYVRGLRKQYERGYSNNRVWNIMLFQMWHERWMK